MIGCVKVVANAWKVGKRRRVSGRNITSFMDLAKIFRRFAM